MIASRRVASPRRRRDGARAVGAAMGERALIAASSASAGGAPPGARSSPAIPHISSAPRPRSGASRRAACGRRAAALIAIPSPGTSWTFSAGRSSNPPHDQRDAAAGRQRAVRARAHAPSGSASTQRTSGMSLWLGTVIGPQRRARATAGSCSTSRARRGARSARAARRASRPGSCGRGVARARRARSAAAAIQRARAARARGQRRPARQRESRRRPAAPMPAVSR